ncbi:uncharacterized protein TM35_000091890 [Trypanosoma theileri]|uniref:Uncharacterized protein n=1 Tax=Trypanosoma theileri TaxID=67003 RepID=A0A1X0P0U7_9TRYP|nr:uncharacterized protein TM35_000091890 [Trypanosoma theileri]ORC90139.1 hypothetical protein TM35_000091890 [Trypanosoma theileri]
MIEPLQDAYVDYLGGLLLQSDIDLSIVRETLALLGFDENTIGDILGENLHRCSTSSSSFSSESNRRSLSQSLTIDSCEPVLTEERKKERGSMRQQHQQQREQRISHEVLIEEEYEEPHPCSVPTLSSSPISGDTESPSCELHSPYHTSSSVNSEEKRLLVSSRGLCWEAITTPERRSRYRELLHALEELLGVVWGPIPGNNNSVDGIPLEVRSFVCRNRLQKILQKRNKMENTFPLQPKHERKVLRPSLPVFSQKASKVRVQVQSRNGHGNDDIMHLRTHKPPRCFRSERRACVTDHQRQCELCMSLEYGSLFRQSKRHPLQLQDTPAAVGNACGVKMQPRAVNCVGTGRINRKALVTTLPQREDRVKMALAYRDEWNAVSFLTERENVPWWTNRT